MAAKYIVLLIVALLYMCCVQVAWTARENVLLPNEPLQRLAFGSCSMHTKAQPLWHPILQYNPQVFAWLGDIIYSDRDAGWKRVNVTDELIAERFNFQKQRKDYQDFVASGVHIVGIWDDHDYGINNGDSSFPLRIQAQKHLLDFLDEPAHSDRRNPGIYASYTYGPSGKQTKLIMLDIRYFASHPKPANPNEPHDLLGEEQWQWLERELSTSSAQVHIIASGIQVVSDDKSAILDVESWGRYPASRRRLFELIGKHKVPGAFFISGDIHISELCRVDCSPATYTMWDLTSSGMTHSWGEQVPEYFVRFAAWVLPTRFRFKGPYGRLNYGAITIDWDASPVKIYLKTHNLDHDAPVLSHAISLAELRPPEAFQQQCTEEAIELSTRWYRDVPGWSWWRLRFIVFLTSHLLPLVIFVAVVGRFCRQFCFRRLTATTAKEKLV